MNIPSFLLTTVFALTAATYAAESKFSVDQLSPSRHYVHVDGAWQDGAECIEAKVSVSEPMEYEKAGLKAYFYSADGKLVHEVNKPSAQAVVGSSGTVKPPSELKVGKKYPFFFAIPDKIKSGASKWKRVVVVFGAPNAAFDAKVYPKDDLQKFEFPEKAMMRK